MLQYDLNLFCNLGQVPLDIFSRRTVTMKKILSLVLVAMLVLAGAALAEGKVGVAMPTQDLQR